MDDMLARQDAKKNWEDARRAAMLEEVSGVFGFKSTDLLSFEEVKKRLHLKQKHDKGIQEVPLEQIRGSVGRYKDFTASFRPRKDEMADRWKRVSAVSYAKGMDPVALYKVGDAYFVLDGHHRVSIARQDDIPTIEAHVWEFQTNVPLSGEADLDEVLLKEERRCFLKHTLLDEIRPAHGIEVTEPGAYVALEYQIEMYRRSMEVIDEEHVSYHRAVALWYDMLYTPACLIIREEGVMERFPDRTEADLFVWIWREHRRYLRQNRTESLAETAHRIKQPGLVRTLREWWHKLSTLFSG